MRESESLRVEMWKNCLDQVKPEDLVSFLKIILTDLLKDLVDNCKNFDEVKVASYIVGGLSSEINKQICPKLLKDLKNKLRKKIKTINPFRQDRKSQDFTTLEKDCRLILGLFEKAMQTSGSPISPKAGENFWLKNTPKYPPLNVF